MLQLKSPYKDGTTHIAVEPLEFMERLAALVPRPRLHLIRFHGVLAPNAKLRSKIVRAPPERAAETSSESAHAQGATPRRAWARLLKRASTLNTARTARGAPRSSPEPSSKGRHRRSAGIVKILTHLGLPTRAPPRAPAQRFDLFQQSEEPKTACQRKPTAPLALSSSERRDPAHFARLRPLRRPSGRSNIGIFIKQKDD